MTRGKIWDYLHNGVGEEYVGEKSVIIPSSSDDGDKDLSDDNDGDGGDGIKVTINRKLDLLRDEPPNPPSPSHSFCLGWSPQYRGGAGILLGAMYSGLVAQPCTNSCALSSWFIPRNVPTVLTLLFRTLSGCPSDATPARPTECCACILQVLRFCPKKERNGEERGRGREGGGGG